MDRLGQVRARPRQAAPAPAFSVKSVLTSAAGLPEVVTLVNGLPDSVTSRTFAYGETAFTPEVPAGDGYSLEIEHFARAVAGETVEPIVTPEQSRETIRLVLAEKQSARERMPVTLA